MPAADATRGAVMDHLIEQGVLIGYWDEAELAGQHAARECWLAKR